MPQQVEAKVHIHWVLHYLPTLGLTGICPEPKARTTGRRGRWWLRPAMAPPPAARLPAHLTRPPLTWSVSAPPSWSHGRGGGKSGKREGKKSGARRARTGRGHGGAPAGQRRLAEAAARRLTAGTESRAAPPLERRGPCAASPVTPASSSPVTPRRCHVPERQGPMCTVVPLPGLWRPPGPPCRWGWGPVAPQAPLRRLLLPETWNRFAQPGWSLNFFNPRLFDHCVM